MAQKQLKRTLGLGECVFFGVGSILGAGIYSLLGKVAGISEHMIWLSFSIASITALFSAFSYAELSAAFPRSGGEYQYAKEAFGKKTGGFLGTVISLNGTISGAAVSIGFAGYLTELLPLHTLIASLGIIAFVFIVNLSGIRQSSVTNIVLTIIEVAGLILAIYCALPNMENADYTALPQDGWNGVFIGAALSFFAYIGFEEIVKLAEETKEPGKTIPRALFITSAIVFVIYSVVAITAVGAVDPAILGESESPLAKVVDLRLGTAGVTAISIIALFSTTNTILSNMLGGSRVLYSMGNEMKGISWLGKVLNKRKTPGPALLLIFLGMSAIALLGDLRFIALLANFFIFITFLVVNSSVIALRIKQPDIDRPFRIPGSINNVPVFSCLAILLTLAMLAFTVMALREGVDI